MIIDLGLVDHVLERDTPKASFCMSPGREVSDEVAQKAGKCLNDKRAISFVFLMLGQTDKAFQICEQIENGIYKSKLQGTMSIGESLMLSFYHSIRNGKYEGWEVKIKVALYILKMYKAITILDPNFGHGQDLAIKRFDTIERYFIDPVRIAFYDICNNITSDKAKDLLDHLNVQQDWKRMETGILNWMNRSVGKNENELLETMLSKLDDFDIENQAIKMLKDNYTTNTALRESEIFNGKAIELKHGMCLIINQEDYDKNCQPHFEKRYGSHQDEVQLSKVLRKFGCKIQCKRDLKSGQLVDEIIKFRNSIDREVEYVFVCILAHGRLNEAGREEIVGVDGVGVSTEYLTNLIIDGNQCPILLGKPKIFLIQACRGTLDMETRYLRISNQPERQPDSGIDSDGQEIGVKSYYAIFNSTVKGHSSFRHKIEGTHFIQIFCANMDKYGHLESFNSICQKTKMIMPRVEPRMVPILENTIGPNLYFKKRDL